MAEAVTRSGQRQTLAFDQDFGRPSTGINPLKTSVNPFAGALIRMKDSDPENTILSLLIMIRGMVFGSEFQPQPPFFSKDFAQIIMKPI